MPENAVGVGEGALDGSLFMMIVGGEKVLPSVKTMPTRDNRIVPQTPTNNDAPHVISNYSIQLFQLLQGAPPNRLMQLVAVADEHGR